jgi:hypothetical protein
MPSTLATQFYQNADRYQFDAIYTPKHGWCQVDTPQDASYFGIWANPKLMEVASYMEGDWSLRSFDEPSEFAEWVRNMLSIYDRTTGKAMIDGHLSPELIGLWTKLGLEDRLH